MEKNWIEKWLPRLALAAGGVILFLYAIKVYLMPGYSDYGVFYKAGERALGGQWNLLYNVDVDQASPFRYIPLTLLAFIPLAALPFWASRLVWYFLQFGSFALGFWFLYQCLRSEKSQRDLRWVIAFAFILSVRYFLDCLMIGQSTGFMFLGYSLALWAWMEKKDTVALLALFVPTALKIGSGINYVHWLKEWRRFFGKAMLLSAGIVLVLNFLLLAYLGSWEIFLNLYRGWWDMILMDAHYVDASHYASQSFNSLFQKLKKAGLLGDAGIALGNWITRIGLCVLIVGVWLRRKPRNLRGQGLFFGLGVWAFLLLMPETFKYSMNLMAIPLVFLISSGDWHVRASRVFLSWRKFVFIFSFLMLTVPGLDVVGNTIFGGVQKLSLPLLAMVFLTVLNFQEAWHESA